MPIGSASLSGRQAQILLLDWLPVVDLTPIPCRAIFPGYLMNHDVYSPPAAALVDNELAQNEFYVVSKRKFLILYLTTMSIYQIYWFYRNWKLQKLAKGLNVWPVPRAIFSIFFYHSLFRLIDQKTSGNGKISQWNSGMSATLIVVLLILSTFVDQLFLKLDVHFLLQFFSLVLLPFSALLHLPAQSAINQGCGDPQGESNDSMTVGNYCAIGLGLLLWAMTMFGIFAVGMEQAG